MKLNLNANLVSALKAVASGATGRVKEANLVKLEYAGLARRQDGGWQLTKAGRNFLRKPQDWLTRSLRGEGQRSGDTGAWSFFAARLAGWLPVPLPLEGLTGV